MSHFATVVLVDRKVRREEAEEAVEPLLAPYEEGEEWFEEGTRWDGYEVGGRWTGCLTPGYDPSEDPANQEECGLCNGTGVHPTTKVTNACNGCEGNSPYTTAGKAIPSCSCSRKTGNGRWRTPAAVELPWSPRAACCLTSHLTRQHGGGAKGKGALIRTGLERTTDPCRSKAQYDSRTAQC